MRRVPRAAAVIDALGGRAGSGRRLPTLKSGSTRRRALRRLRPSAGREDQRRALRSRRARRAVGAPLRAARRARDGGAVGSAPTSGRGRPRRWRVEKQRGTACGVAATSHRSDVAGRRSQRDWRRDARRRRLSPRVGARPRPSRRARAPRAMRRIRRRSASSSRALEQEARSELLKRASPRDDEVRCGIARGARRCRRRRDRGWRAREMPRQRADGRPRRAALQARRRRARFQLSSRRPGTRRPEPRFRCRSRWPIAILLAMAEAPRPARQTASRRRRRRGRPARRARAACAGRAAFSGGAGGADVAEAPPCRSKRSTASVRVASGWWSMRRL